MSRRAALALGALAAILAITAAWWALALWPASATVPAWVERTRAACFGVAPDGLPHAGGWILLVGEPLGMLGFLWLGWRGALREGLRALRASGAGRVALAGCAAALLAGAATAGVRVRGALAAHAAPAGGGTAVRVDRPAPPLALVDQRGDTVRLAELRGRPVVVAFAYAHCETVCPVLVHDAARAVRAAAATGRGAAPTLLVVTLDPWRDTPARLPHLARAWALPPDARVLGGDVATVERTLRAWSVAHRRDEATGEIVHAPVVVLLGRDGRVAWVTDGGASLASLLARL